MKKEEFVNRLAGIVYNIEIIDDSYQEETRESGDDGWDRGDTSTSHNIVGFHAAPESENKYYDLAVPFNPKEDVTYYVLYAVYSTGDSFGHDSGSSVEYIGFYTEDELDIANENMRKVENSTKDNDNWSVELKTPNGHKTFDQHTPWIGYFEHLDYVELAGIQRQ